MENGGKYQLLRTLRGEPIHSHWGADDTFETVEDALHRIREYIAYSAHSDVHDVAKVEPDKIDLYNREVQVHITDIQIYHIVPTQAVEIKE